MFSPTRCLLALAIVPSLAFAQGKEPPPGVSGTKIDPVPVRADPMPQGIKDLLMFRGAPAEWRPPPVQKSSPLIKGLSSADKLGLVRRAAGPSGASAAGSSMGPYLMLSRATMWTEGRGALVLLEASNISHDLTLVAPRRDGGAVILDVYPEAAGRLYLAEWQVSGSYPFDAGKYLPHPGQWRARAQLQDERLKTDHHSRRLRGGIHQPSRIPIRVRFAVALHLG